MNRRGFLKAGGLAAATAGLHAGAGSAYVPTHNWDRFDFGYGPTVTDRLNQGPFPQYPPEAVFPGGDVVMATTPSREVVPNFGKGLVTYITADMGTAEIKSDNIPQAIEDLVRLPLGEKLYLRPTWREVQRRPGRLDFPDYWKLTFDLAKQYKKRVGFRIQMRAPDYSEEALPEVLEAMMPYLTTEWGNPFSAYKFGAKLKSAIATAREQVAELIGAHSLDVVFTSRATESNNTALAAALKANPAKRHIVTSQVEHSSVLNYCMALEKTGTPLLNQEGRRGSAGMVTTGSGSGEFTSPNGGVNPPCPRIPSPDSRNFVTYLPVNRDGLEKVDS